jgi:hypothetical protein
LRESFAKTFGNINRCDEVIAGLSRLATLRQSGAKSSKINPAEGSSATAQSQFTDRPLADTKPLNNVSVTAYFASNKKEKVVVSDGNGNYAFNDLKPGTYKFVFEKDGYKKVTKEKIIIKTDDGFLLNIEMMEEKDFDFVPGAFNF